MRWRFLIVMTMLRLAMFRVRQWLVDLRRLFVAIFVTVGMIVAAVSMWVWAFQTIGFLEW